MDIFEVIEKRRSVRKYEGRDIADDDLRKILEAARLAPSAYNAQEYKIFVVKEKQKKEVLASAVAQPFIAQAPVILAGIALNPDRKYYAIDIAIAFDHISLSATALGIGSCWIGAFGNEQIKEIIGAPENSKVVILMPLGYPADKPIPKMRKSFDELVEYK
jgi:nitroreductase